ncbi:putative DNA repair and recombination protein RAD54 [Trypanosoma rangeli]|uniref:Putative DNA repair and recombination protein RAD54 n=1 Tax=Trypanosoma rangeli TaxID=5698 RepID=A0A422NTS1_TRYRA|nr:putative DNA repair and recombination protein RAD54 [Trypanosoma rangeli]RNF08865.1 putative DNA repair and recombination protein RAD54 [Trypanosoma rangeli]|eukprot:RNF08865.1 putative DNA repair and recombination protein RAD54 [Trypanosoma rangeli]
MADRLRASLLSYFSRHMERADWQSALRALRGCAETGTLLHSLPHDKLFPFLVANGQWEFVLRLSSQLIAVEDAKRNTGKGSTGTTASLAQEEGLYNTLLRATLADEAVSSMGSWKAAAAIVQRATRRRVRLETSVIKDVLNTIEKWQHEIATGSGGSGSSSTNGGPSAGGASPVSCDALLLTRDLLAASLHLRGESAPMAESTSICRTPRVLQQNLVQAIHTAVFQGLVVEDENNPMPWQRLREKLHASCASSLYDAVYTVLHVCAPHTNPSGGIEAGETVEPVLQATIDCIAVRPDVAEEILHWTLQRLFDDVIVTPRPSGVVGVGHHDDDAEYKCCSSINEVALAWWRRELEQKPAMELPKWEMSRALAMAELEQRERRWTMAEDNLGCWKQEPKKNSAHMLTLTRLCIATQLLFLSGDVAGQQRITESLDDTKHIELECVARKLLLHGAVVTANGADDSLITFLSNTVHSLMMVYIRLCCVRDYRQQMLLNTVAEAREDRPHTPTGHSGGFTVKSNNAGIIDGTPSKSALASGREVFWRNIIFPHTLSGWQNSPIAAAWQALLRHVLCDASLLKMWFQGDESLKSHITVLDRRHTSSADMAEDNTAGGGHGRRGRRRRRGGGSASGVTPSSFCREERLRQLQELVYFLSRRFSFDNNCVMFPLLHLEKNNETWQDLQTDVTRTAGMDADKNVRLSALSTLLTRHEEVEEIGRALFQACVRDDLALADASNVWRTFIFSIAPQQVAPLLRCMMDFAATESHDGIGRSSSFAALVVVMHESDVFSSEDKARYTVLLLNSIEPVTKSWRVALALFGEAASKISEPPLDGKNDRSLRHILDTLLVSAVPPRWREALQVVEIVHELVPNVGKAQNMDEEDASTGGTTGPLPGRTPLSDSERIDLYEALAPLKRRRHWMSAMELFTVYEARQLSGHDCACFAFAVADGPLSFARRVLLSLRGREKSREVARAALVTSWRYVKQSVRALKQRQNHQLEQRESGLLEQERMLVLHEATQVARLALTVWPTAITSDEDFRLIWKLIKGICAGNVAEAKLLLRQSGLYDSEQANNEADALTRTVRLCHAAQDAASATAAYETFRNRFIGMVLPEETMLQLLTLCVSRVVDGVEDGTTRDRIRMLHTVLRDTLWMHDSSLRYEGSHTTMPRNCMLQVCILLFRLSAPSESRAVMGIPKFSCDMTPNMQRHAQRLLVVVTNHLVSSDARLLRNLPDFIGVLRALPPFCLGAVAASAPTSTSKKLWADSITTLTHHVQHLEKTLGPVVPVECLFWLGILQSEQTVSGAPTPSPSLLSTTGEEGEEEKVSGREFREVPRWDPEAFVVLNDLLSTQEATALVNRTILFAVESATRGDAESLTMSSSLRVQLLPCIMEALVFLLHRRWHAQPPLTATLAAAAYAVQSLHDAPEWISSEAAMDILVALHTIFAAFHVRHTIASLAVLAHPMHRLSSAVDAILSGAAYEAVRHMHDFVLLTSAWMQKCLQAAEGAERRVLNERQIHFMIWIAGNLTGTCASWPDSPLREECMHQLSRSCEIIERCVNCGYTSPVSCSALLLLRVMRTILQKGPLSNDTAEAFFSATSVSKHSNSSHLDVGFPADNASLSVFLMAMTLLHIVYQGTRPDMRLLRAFLPALQLEEELQKTLHDDEAFVGGLIAMQSARLNATAAVRRALGVSLSLSTRFIVRLVEFSPMLSLEASTVQWLRSEEQLAEVAIFAALASCRGGGTPEEHDIVEAMDAVGTLVPHRWDLPYAMALGFPLPARQSVTPLERTLRQRLAVVLQYCGPWPGGIVLALLLKAVWPALDTKKDDGVLPDYNQLLEVMATLSLDRRWKMISITPSLPHETSPLFMRRVALWHRQASTAACIIMGNAIPHQQEQQRQQRQRCCEAWNALSTSDAAVQFLVIAYVVAPLLGTRSTSQERWQQQLLLADMKSWISSSSTSASNLSWPWQSLSAEARQLLLWSRIALMLPQWEIVREQKRETIAAEQSVIAATVSLVSSSHAVSSSFSSHFGKSERIPSALSYATTDARAAGFSCILCFRHALFNTAWIAEMCAKQFMLEHPSIYARLCRALRVLPDPSLMGMNANDVEEDVTNATESLFATPSGFSSLQYACALVDTANEAAELRSERGFLLLLACARSMQEASELLESRLSQRLYVPLRIQSLLAAWNTLLIRSVELEWEGEAGTPPMGRSAAAHADLDVEEHKNEKKGNAPLRHRVAAAFLALALTSGSNACDVPISVSSLQPEEAEKLLQRLYREIFAHSATVDALHGATLNTTPSESRFYRASTEIVTRAILILPKASTSASFFDGHVASAIEFVRQYMRGDTVSWVSLWPPLVLEMRRSCEYVKCLQEQKQSPVSPCKLRHPVAVSWMMQQSAAHTTLLGTVTRPLMVILNTLRLYVMTGTASFPLSQVATVKETAKATEDNSATFYGVRGAGAGMVVDQFLSMALRGWVSTHPNDSTKARDRDVIRHLVDAVLPHPHIVDSSALTSSLFLSGYTPLTTDGLQSLARLLVVRDGFDKRRTASINHVGKFLRMEKQREMARRIAARDAGLPLTRVHFGRPRGSRDVQVQLLFYLRALAAALTFVNPMAWHGERQASLDAAYTALMDFLHLCFITYGEDVDIASRQVKAELEGIFGRGVMRVVSAAASQPDSIVNVRQLLHFLTEGLHHHHHRGAKGERRDAALSLNRRLRELLRLHKRGGEVSDVLLLKGDDAASATAPAMSLFTQMTSIVRESLWNTAVVPSHDVVLELLDVAVTTGVSDSAKASVETIHAARCGLQLFETIAPYIVVPTIMLEKVLMLLLVVLRSSVAAAAVDETARKQEKELFEAILHLVLRRFQYVPLNTPTAVVLLCELYAAATTMNTTSAMCKSAREVCLGTCISHFPLPPGSEVPQLPQAEWLLWRCVVEANQVPWSLLQAALSSASEESLRLLQHGCCAFLLQDHRKPHYDPPFLRLGRMLDTMILQEPGDANAVTSSGFSGIHVSGSFTAQLLRKLEVRPTGIASSVVPWHRALQFLPESQDGSVDDITDMMRFRFYVTLMSQLLTSATKGNNGVRQVWQHALSVVLPQLASAKGKKEYGMDLIHHGTACALRMLHIVQPSNEWDLALQLTLQLPASAMNSVSWWSSPEAPLFHTLRYLIEVCDVATIPITALVSYMQVVGKRQLSAAGTETTTGRFNRLRVVAAFTARVQRHPRLSWVDALALLESLSVLEKGFSKPTAKEASNQCPNNNTSAREHEVQQVLTQAKGEFVTAVMGRLYKKQSYESLLRFVEAAQQYCRVSGRESMAWINHAASVVVAPCQSGGLSEVLLLLNGTLMRKTFDDILREHSAGVLQKRVCLMQDLLRSGHCVDAAVLSRQTPALLGTREFYDACTRLMNRSHHSDVVAFYDAFIHPEEELEVETRQADEACMGGGDRAMTALLEEEVRYAEDADLLRHVPSETLQQAMDAFEVAANAANGINTSEKRTGLWIAATWIRRVTPLMQAQHSLAATLRWVHRDLIGGTAGKPDRGLYILADAVRDMLHETASHGSVHSCGTPTAKASLTAMLGREREVARLLVETLSGTFPGTASELCESLLPHERHPTREPGVDTALDHDNGDANNNDEVWWSFLHCTAAYNVALEEAFQHCRTLVDTSVIRGSARNPVVEWRDRALFRNGGTSHAWVLALAAYATARSFVGHTSIIGAHMARLVKLITASGSLRVVLPTARNVLFQLPSSSLNSGESSLLLDALLLLCSAMRTMKQHTMHRFRRAAEVQSEELQAILEELHELHRFVGDGLALLLLKQQQQQRAPALQGAPLDGRVELACNMLRCLTVTPAASVMYVTTLEDWRSLVQRIFIALPPAQRRGDLLDAFMESVRDSSEVLSLLRQHPVSALTSFQEACNGLWCNALGIISADGNFQCHLFSHANAQQQKAMTQLEILICCAGLASDHGAAAMRSLCDVVVRAHSVPLSEDAKALVKMACIHGKGTAWRSEYEAITGFAPSTVRRQTTLAPAKEALEQSFCLRALDAVEDWAQALRLGQAKREVGVRLQHAHYQRMLYLVGQHNTEDAETVALNTVVADAVMGLHFARLQDGCFPNTHAIEQSLRLLSAQTFSPLFVLQYAQALTLLPPLTNRQHRKPENHSGGTGSANGSSLSLAQEDLSFTVSAVMLRLVTRAALRLPDAVRQHRLDSNEGVEGLHMFAAFIRWVSEFSRVPCFDRGVVEVVVLLLCTPPKQLLSELTTTQNGTHRCDAGDVRRLLLSALLAHCDDGAPIVDLRSYVTCLESYRFVSLRCNHKEEDGKDNEEYIPTLTTLSVLRSHAEVALRFVGKQASLHHVMRLSKPLLCRMCAAVVAGMTVTAEGLQPLNQLMQNTELISPSLRYMLTLIVAEQSTLWGIYYTAESDPKKKASVGHRIGRRSEVPVSVVLRSVAGAYDVVRQHFTPSDALMLRGLLLPKHLSATTTRADHSGDQHGEEEDEEDYCCKDAMKSPEGKKEEDDEKTMDYAAPNIVWENALNLFDVFLRNAQPDADLSVPFEALIELLCRWGQWKTACRNVTLAGAPTIGTMNTPQTMQHRHAEKEDASHLLPRHVVVDGFLLKRLLDSMEAAQQRHHRRGEKSLGGGGLDPDGGPPGFWWLALHLLRQQQQQQVLLLNEMYLDGTEKCDVMISSVTLLAIMKTISQGRGDYAPR